MTWAPGHFPGEGAAETPLTVAVAAPSLALPRGCRDRLGLRLSWSCFLGSGLDAESALGAGSEPFRGFPTKPSRLMGNFCSFVGCLKGGGGGLRLGRWAASESGEEEEEEEEEEKEGSLLMGVLLFPRSKVQFWLPLLQAPAE